MKNTRKAFLITVDTEGDNLWARPKNITTENAKFLPRFQSLCEKYNFKPTYLTNWEMASSACFVEFGKDVHSRSSGEIGMHLHAWNSPPLEVLTTDDFHYQPYLYEYPAPVILKKVSTMTRFLEDQFGLHVRSHRAGRWGFNELYARALLANGYAVDCSVTPGVSWESSLGAPSGMGGPDYRDFPNRPYLVDPKNVARALDPGMAQATGSLLEVPVTSAPAGYTWWIRALKAGWRTATLQRRTGNKIFPDPIWMALGRGNRAAFVKLAGWAGAQDCDYAELALHSSELMPGGSPTFPTGASIERLYESLEAMFSELQGRFQGCTLNEYHRRFWNNKGFGKELVPPSQTGQSEG